jgi:hypothetical protein
VASKHLRPPTRTECFRCSGSHQLANGIHRFLLLLGLGIVVVPGGSNRPDFESASQRIEFPGSTDALSLTKAGVENIVCGDIRFRPPALPAAWVIPTADDERADAIIAFTSDSTVAELQGEIHSMTAMVTAVSVETNPRT